MNKTKNIEEQKETKTPNLLVAESLKKELYQTLSEDEKKAEKLFIKKLDSNILDMLNGIPYNFSRKGLMYITGTELGNDEPYIVISNVVVIPKQQINEISADGNVETSIELEAYIAPTGERLEKIRVPISQIENGSCFLDYRWWSKIRFEKPERKRLQVECINLLKQYISLTTVYKFLGFTEIAGEKIFLHAGGAIGAEKDIKVNIENKQLSNYKFTNKEFDSKNILNFTSKLENITNSKTTVVLLATIFTAPILGILDELNIQYGSVTFVLGTEKDEILSMLSTFLSYFGFFDKNDITMSCYDEIPGAKEMIMKCKNIPVLLNCFSNSKIKEVKTQQTFLENIIPLYTDKGADTNKTTGELIVAGAIIPELNRNCMSKILIVNADNLNKSEVVFTKEQQEKLQYTMKMDIEYIINNYEEIKNIIKENFYLKVEEASNIMPFEMAKIITSKYFGLVVLLECAVKNGAVTENEKVQKLQKYWKILCEVGAEQEKEEQQLSLLGMIMFAIEELINAENLTVVDYDSAKYMKPEEIKKNGFIGFYSEKDKANLIYPERLYKAIVDYYKLNDKAFPYKESDICKELWEQGFLYQTPKQERPQIRRNSAINGKEETFIGILTDKINIPCRYLDRGLIFTKKIL